MSETMRSGPGPATGEQAGDSSAGAASAYTAQERQLLKPGYRGLFVGSLFVICCFNFADRAVFSVLAQSIKVDLKLTDLELGVVGSLGFAFLY
ncbi:MAG TPA: hypothetical protein VGO53_10490, partial [Steroidobacteraceae bacterium]|nr:hypothetical protein [Steroidobacteraceae bacterium]